MAMSKRHQKESRHVRNEDNAKFAANLSKIDHNFVLEIVIGSANVKRWNQLKITFSCTTNEELASFLLDLAQKYANETNITHNEPSSTLKEVQECNNEPVKQNRKKDPVKRKKNKSQEAGEAETPTNTQSEAKQQEIPSLKEDNVAYISEKASLSPEEYKENKSRKHRKKAKDHETTEKVKLVDTPKEKQKKKLNYDFRKAPELNEQIEGINVEENASEPVVEGRVAIKIKMCSTCGTRHVQDLCPMQNPHHVIKDAINYEEWCQKYKTLSVQQVDESGEGKAVEDNFTFACMSLPNILYLNELENRVGVFTNANIKEFTQFGPLFGKSIKEVDIPEDFNMKYLWEVCYDKSHSYVNTEDASESNWIRFVRPAPTRDERNLSCIVKENQFYLITSKDILAGEELIYWQDDALQISKKKMEKTTCGGCNMTFEHPLYYRTHCSIFHDMRYSLTIRKYHCKVCGAAVLGKENIMKHAAELHNGQGAYQCQFCKKFFLRLNYLEMHRTYGCSANPHRSRPLCDFCGRKFCQPQKLKVHIKRMHSDLSEVLKEFQCKNCLKLLGSRAALQRHMKEVHNKQVNGACACSRCGKLFQNKSNLKIHMLTHSGIKPFKCKESSCAAAFTTKQCLQFHYKKAHGFTDDQMPKIERSVDYTFEAYSGDHDQELEDQAKCDKMHDQSGFISLNEGSDDENSMDDKAEDLDSAPSDSPIPLSTESPPVSNQSPPMLEPYISSNLKILTKGSKKWLGEQPVHQPLKEDYHIDHLPHKIDSNMVLEVDESQTYERTKLNLNLNAYSRHESSNASLLVEAALDSVTDIHCPESNINIDVDSTPTGTEALVNNLCTLAHPDNLSDVPYSHSDDIAESRDINLISPSVNEPISVTDGENMGIDYSNFHHNDFSPANSPTLQHRSNFSRDYIDVGQVSPQDVQNYNSSQSKTMSPGSSPPRYNFGHGIGAENVSSDDSNGMAAQNLSLHSLKTEAQLDLSIYKSSYSLEAANFQLRKDFGMKLNLEPERKQVYILEINDKLYHDNTLSEENNLSSQLSDKNQTDGFNHMCNKDFESIDSDDLKHKNCDLGTSPRLKYHDPEALASELRSKQFELDLNLRSKSYDLTNDLRTRTSYESALDADFRIKSYDPVDSLEARTALESDFRLDRNFEPLVLNSTELQGLDMSARSYHNYHSSTAVQNLNRYHHLYPEVERPSVDLRLNYSPPLPSYTHSDVLRVVSLDLTSPGRHSVDLSLRSNPLHVHQLGNSRLLSDHTISTNRILTDHNRLTLDQSRLLGDQRLLNSDLSNRHLGGNSRLISDTGNRILSDHSTSRLLSNEQIPSGHLLSSESRLLSEESRLISEQPRLLEQGRLLSEGRILPPAAGSGSVSPLPYGGYSVSPTPYHPTSLTRSHTGSPTPTPYHHYSTYY